VEEIEKAKASPSFPREYELRFLGGIGNVFDPKTIDRAVEKGRNYDPDAIDPYHFSSRSLGIDPAYGSSKFAIVATQWSDDHIQIIYAQEFERPDYADMLDLVYSLMSKYNIDSTYIDGANPSFIKSLKLRIGERADYIAELDRAKREGIKPDDVMKIIPVSFNVEHKAMLGHVKMVLETDGGKLAIHPKFDSLITSLRTATDRDGVLLKAETVSDDLLDALRLSLKFYSFSENK
jgi:hypothetical protein